MNQDMIRLPGNSVVVLVDSYTYYGVGSRNYTVYLYMYQCSYRAVLVQVQYHTTGTIVPVMSTECSRITRVPVPGSTVTSSSDF
jgi:hypothetical protein